MTAQPRAAPTATRWSSAIRAPSPDPASVYDGAAKGRAYGHPLVVGDSRSQPGPGQGP